MTLATPGVRSGGGGEAKPAIIRDRYHRYTYGGVRYRGTTGILKVVDKSDALMGWAARNTAEAALAQLDHLASLRDTVGPEGVIKALTSRSSWKRDEAAQHGSEIHALAEQIHGPGLDITEIPEVIMARVRAYGDWWSSCGWRRRLAEFLVVNVTLGYGGTGDLLAFDEEGRTVLADVKSGAGVYAETRLQLAAYGMAELVAPMGSPQAWPMPEIHRYVVLHVTDDGVRVIDVPVDDRDREAFRACIPLSAWLEERRGRL